MVRVRSAADGDYFLNDVVDSWQQKDIRMKIKKKKTREKIEENKVAKDKEDEEDQCQGRSRGGRCSLFLTMRCFNDAMFPNS